MWLNAKKREIAHTRPSASRGFLVEGLLEHTLTLCVFGGHDQSSLCHTLGVEAGCTGDAHAPNVKWRYTWHSPPAISSTQLGGAAPLASRLAIGRTVICNRPPPRTGIEGAVWCLGSSNDWIGGRDGASIGGEGGTMSGVRGRRGRGESAP